MFAVEPESPLCAAAFDNELMPFTEFEGVVQGVIEPRSGGQSHPLS
jgi:hypothetical protein